VEKGKFVLTMIYGEINKKACPTKRMVVGWFYMC